jgi:hypothetical protein
MSPVSGGEPGAISGRSFSNQHAIILVPTKVFHFGNLTLPSLSSLMARFGLIHAIRCLVALLFQLSIELSLTAVPGDENSAMVAAAFWAVKAANELVALYGISSAETIELRMLADILAARLELIQQYATSATATIPFTSSPARAVTGSASPFLLTYVPATSSANELAHVSTPCSAATPDTVCNRLAIVKVQTKFYKVLPFSFPSLSAILAHLGLNHTICCLLTFLWQLNVGLPFTALVGDENSAVVAAAFWAIKAANELIAEYGLFSVEMVDLCSLSDILAARLALIQQSGAASVSSSALGPFALTGPSPLLLLGYGPVDEFVAEETSSHTFPSSLAAATATPCTVDGCAAAAPEVRVFPEFVPQDSSCRPSNNAFADRPELNKAVSQAKKRKPAGSNRRARQRYNRKAGKMNAGVEAEIKARAHAHASGMSQNIWFCEYSAPWSSEIGLEAFRRLAAATFTIDWRIAEMAETFAMMGRPDPFVTSGFAPELTCGVQSEIREIGAAIDNAYAVLEAFPEFGVCSSLDDMSRLSWLVNVARISLATLQRGLPWDFCPSICEVVPNKQKGAALSNGKLETAVSTDSKDFTIKAKKDACRF